MGNYLHYDQSVKGIYSFDFPAVLKTYLHISMKINVSIDWPDLNRCTLNCCQQEKNYVNQFFYSGLADIMSCFNTKPTQIKYNIGKNYQYEVITSSCWPFRRIIIIEQNFECLLSRFLEKFKSNSHLKFQKTQNTKGLFQWGDHIY